MRFKILLVFSLLTMAIPKMALSNVCQELFFEHSSNSSAQNSKSYQWGVLSKILQDHYNVKDINAVMASQQNLVDVIGKFTPKIVKMCGAETNQWRKPRKAITHN